VHRWSKEEETRERERWLRSNQHRELGGGVLTAVAEPQWLETMKPKVNMQGRKMRGSKGASPSHLMDALAHPNTLLNLMIVI